MVLGISVMIEISILYIFLFFCVLIIGIPIKIQYRNYYIFFFLIFAIAFAVIAFFITGKSGWDLNTHYKVIDMIRHGELQRNQNNNFEYYQLPAIRLLFWIVSQLPSNNYLQSIVIIITYTIFAFIVNFFAKQLNLQSQHVGVFIIVHFALCSFANTISGIRNVMAFAIVSAALVRDLWCGSKGLVTIFLYMTALCIHPACIIIIFLRTLTALSSRTEILKYLYLSWTASIVIILKLGEFLSFIPFIGMLYQKLKMYSNYGFIGVLGNIKYNLARIFILLILISISNHVVNHYLQQDNKRNYIKFWQNLLYFTLGSLPVYHIFDRFLILVAWTGLPILFNYNSITTKYKIPRKYILLIIPGLLLIFMNFYNLYIFSNFLQ